MATVKATEPAASATDTDAAEKLTASTEGAPSLSVTLTLSMPLPPATW